MATEAQIAANRRNAQQSTGPTSAEGKRRVSRNAINHGLDCADILLPEDNKDDLIRYRHAMLVDHQPRGAEEQDLVERMVACQWRIRRAWKAETEMHSRLRYMLHAVNPRADVGDTVLEDLRHQKGFAYLDRKEAGLAREYHRCSARLVVLQALRRKGLRHVVEEYSSAVLEPVTQAKAARVGAEGVQIEVENEAPSASTDAASAETAEQSQTGVNAPKGEAVTTEPGGATASNDGISGEIAEQSQLEEVARGREAA